MDNIKKSDKINWHSVTVKTYSTEDVASACKTSEEVIKKVRKREVFKGLTGKSQNDFVGDIELIKERYDEYKRK